MSQDSAPRRIICTALRRAGKKAHTCLLSLLKQISEIDKRVINWNGLPEKIFVFVDHAEDGFKLRLLSHCWKILGSPQLSAAEWAPEIGAVVKRPRDWTTSSFFSDTMPHIVVLVSMGVPGDLLRIWERGFHSRSSVSFTFRALGPVQYKSELIEWADGVGKSKFSVGAAAQTNWTSAWSWQKVYTLATDASGKWSVPSVATKVRALPLNHSCNCGLNMRWL